MALYVGDICFDQLKKVDAINKSMMESWTLSERTYEPNKSFYSHGQAFDPMGTMAIDGGPLEGNPLFQNDQVQTLKRQYEEFSWLIPGPKKRR